MVDDVVTYTNVYAQLLKEVPDIQRRINMKRRSLHNLWKDVNRDEIWTYFAIQMLMGIIHKPHYHMYWSKDSVLSTPIFSRLMRRDRFEQIRKMIHFVDPTVQSNNSCLAKLEIFLNTLKQNFQTNYTLSKHVAIDEYLSLWKGETKVQSVYP